VAKLSLLVKSTISNLITPPFLGGVFVCLVVRHFNNSIIADNTLWRGTTHRHISAIRQRIRQYAKLCLIAEMLTEIGLQLPIKTIRQ